MEKTFDLVWSPEGRRIATVEAESALAAIRKAPEPYRQYPGEIYAVEVGLAVSVFVSLPHGHI
jgi:hypothetical protein